MTEPIDVSRAPRGVLAAQELIAAVKYQGDMAERHYLELKSTLDLSAKKDKEKIAKFILGAANRMPDVALTAFEGYGVMIIGVSKGSITGIPPVEMMEISKVIQQYVGAAGPRWDVIWIPVEDSTNQVLVVIVDPPKTGQGPFPCRASGESLTDGRIYIRAEGETREAKAEEVDLLIQRGNAVASVEVDFAVEVIGEVACVTVDTATTIDEYVGTVRQRLLSALPRKPSEQPATSYALTVGAAELTGYQSTLHRISAMVDVMTEPEKRTEDDYRASILHWEERFREAWNDALPEIAGSQLRSAIVRVTNRTTTFFHDVKVKLHLAGDIFAYDYKDPKYTKRFSELKLPSPPRKWGPTQRSSLLPGYANMASLHTPSARKYIPLSVSYKNGGSVALELDVGELRPRGIYESENEELILVVKDEALTGIEATWELTARDHNDVYTGEFTVQVGQPRDLTGVARQILGLAEDEDKGADS